MPVSRQKAEDPGEIVDAPPLNRETLEYTVARFKKHHEDCALRRKNGISFEIHAEQQRTELLKRKYFDNLRQQQALSGRIEEPRVKEQSGGPFETDHIFDPSSIKPSPSTPDKFHPVFLDNSRLCAEDMNIGGSNARSAIETSTGPSNIMTSPENRNGSTLDGFLPIKSEPESGETTPTCLKSSPVPSGCTMSSKAPPSSLLPFPLPLSGTTNCRNSRTYCTPDAKRKKRMLPSPLRGPSFSSTDEAEDDDLKLRAEDCIDGVISTPPIKPLEEGDDPPITPSPTSMGTAGRCPSNPPTNTSTGSNLSNPPSIPTPGPAQDTFTMGNSNSTNMAEDLNEFYQVMKQVEEKGRLSSAASVSASSTSSSNHVDMYKSTSVSPPNMMCSQASQHLLSPPPYHTAMSRPPQPMPLAPSAGYYGAQHPSVPVSHTSPASSPPFSSPNMHCFNPPLPQQLSSSSLGIQPSQPHPQQQQQLHTPPPSRSQVDVNMQYPNSSLLQQQLQAKHQNQSQLLPKSHQPQMHMVHMTQSDAARPLMTPMSLSAPITSPAFSFPHNQAQRIHTSVVPSLPPHPPPPHTPTTPLEHFHTFPTPQSTRISPTNRPNQFHHPVAGATVYPYGPEGSQLPANHPQNPHIQRQLMHSSAVSIATSSWGIQTPGVSGFLVQPRTHIDSLPSHQKPIQTVANLGSYPLQKVGHAASIVHQPHHPPPTYLPSYGSESPIAAPFPCLFPPNM